MKIFFVIATLFKLTMAIATLGRPDEQDEHTTLPTELFKPLLPVTEQPVKNAYQTSPQLDSSYSGNSARNSMGEEYGSEVQRSQGPSHSVFSERSRDYEPSISGIQPNNFPNTFSQTIQRPNFYNIFSNSHSYPQGPMQTGSYSQFSNTGNEYFPTGLHDIPDSDSGNGHYRYSSSSTYYNSNTMGGPETHGFEYDSRKGGFEFK